MSSSLATGNLNPVIKKKRNRMDIKRMKSPLTCDLVSYYFNAGEGGLHVRLVNLITYICLFSLEVFVQRYLAFDSCLVGGYSSLEEVGQFLHILELHEPEGIRCPVGFRYA